MPAPAPGSLGPILSSLAEWEGQVETRPPPPGSLSEKRLKDLSTTVGGEGNPLSSPEAPCSRPLPCAWHLSSPATRVEQGGRGPFSPYSDLWVFQVPGTLVRLHLSGLREDLAGFSGSSEPTLTSPPHVPPPPVGWGRWRDHAGPDRV